MLAALRVMYLRICNVQLLSLITSCVVLSFMSANGSSLPCLCERCNDICPASSVVLLDTDVYCNLTRVTFVEDESVGGNNVSEQCVNIQNSAPPCGHDLSTCSCESGERTSWMITQYISISGLSVAELNLYATFSDSLLTCNDTCDCTQTMGIRIYETSEKNESDCLNSSSFSKDLATLGYANKSAAISISESTMGLYLALVDGPAGACLTLSRLVVYFCQEEVGNGIEYSIKVPLCSHRPEAFPKDVCINCSSNSSSTSPAVSNMPSSIAGLIAALSIAAGVVAFVFLAVTTTLVVYLLAKRRHRSETATEHDAEPLSLQKLASEMTDDSEVMSGKSVHIPPKTNRYVDPCSYPSLTDAMRQLGVQDIPSEELSKLDEIARGEFGFVYKASWVLQNVHLTVAVKILKSGATQEEKEHFLMEALVMAQFSHPNVVHLCGLVNTVEPVMLVMEYMENGSLDEYLKKYPGKLGEEKQLKIALDVASGMKCLSNAGFVHKDLAARNVLVSKDEVCKVADFCLKRELKNCEPPANPGGRKTLRWAAPEAITHNRATSASDVWSYGVLLWEIMTYGQIPYEGMNSDVLLDQLEKGMRLEQPLNCPHEVYQLMRRCWTSKPRDRPTFARLEENLMKMIEGINNVFGPMLSMSASSSDLKVPIKKWLQDIQMQRYCDHFIKKGLRNLGDILELNEDNLKEMGIVLIAHQQLILRQICIEKKELQN